jgi:hypothetical protein
LLHWQSATNRLVKKTDEKAEAGNARSRYACARETIRKSGGWRLAQEDGRSLANWLERLIEAEAARHDGKK